MSFRDKFDDFVYRVKSLVNGNYVDDDGDIYDDIDEAETDYQALNRPTATYSGKVKKMEQPSYKQNLTFVTKSSDKKDEGIAKIRIYSPKSFADATTIADDIKDGKAVVLNILDSPISLEQSQRLCDFLVGICYAEGAEVEVISEDILIMTPKGYDVSREQKRDIRKSSMAMASGFGR